MPLLATLLAVAALQSNYAPVIRRINGYTLVLRARPGDRYDLPSSTVVKDRQGKVIFTASDYDTGIVWIKDIAGDGVPVAAISAFTGGAHCCETDYFLSLGTHPKLIGCYAMGNLSGIEPKKRRGGKGFDIFTDFDGYAYYQASYASSAHIPMVFRFQHGRLEEATKDFPDMLKTRYATSKKALENAISDHEQEFVRKESSQEGLFDAGLAAPAIELIALSKLLRNRLEADEFLKSTLSVADYEKLTTLTPEIEQILASRTHRLTYPALPLVHVGLE